MYILFIISFVLIGFVAGGFGALTGAFAGVELAKKIVNKAIDTTFEKLKNETETESEES